MTPILYESTETNFTSNGLGRLPDAIECVVTEERNGAYELRMMYPIDGLHFSDIQKNRFIYAVPADGKGKQPFRIYSISKPLDGIVEINAEHISYQLSHIPVSPFEAGSLAAALVGLKDNAAEACPFTFWTDKTVTGNFKVTEPVSLRSRLGGVEGSLLDVYGTGEYEFDHYTVKLHLHRGTNNGVTLRYGKNITDIKQEENIANTYTGVMPFWKGDVDGTETTIMLTEKVLHSANAANFPYQRTIPLDLSSNFENQPTEAQLRSAANSYMTSNDIGVPAVSIDVSFIALWQTEEYKDVANLERVNLCDTVTVEFPALGVSAQAKVVKTEYDVLRDRYQSLELGDAKTNFTQTLSAEISSNTSAMKQLPTKSYMQKAVDHATELITGGLGGHVVMKANADGEPEEILIMDTDDVNTAVNVIRINQAGIGFSTDGYDGPFSTAWTIDGHFVADFIDTGNLNATLITTGVLKDHGSNFVLDLLTGTLTAKKGSINLGNGNFSVTDAGLVTIKKGSINLGSGNFQVTDGGVITMKKGSINIADKFIVTTGGALTATSADITGKITANSGKIGSFSINNDLTYGSPLSWLSSESDSKVRIGAKGVMVQNANLATALVINGGDIYYRTSGSKLAAITIEDDSEESGKKMLTIKTPNPVTSGSLRESIRVRTGVVEINPYTSLKVLNDAHINGDYFSVDGWARIYGDFVVDGTKNRLVTLDDHTQKLLYCYETASPMFGDVGEGLIGDDGQCFIPIDAVFSQTVTLSQYQVFLQKYGNGECYVSERNPSYFIVKGEPGLSFGWEIKAKQSDFDQYRLETFYNDDVKIKNKVDYTSFTDELVNANDLTYASSAENHINSLKEGYFS